MSASGVDSMFFSDVTEFARQIDQALLALKSSSADSTAIASLADQLLSLGSLESESVSLRLLLTLADHGNRGLEFWSQVGERLRSEAHATIPDLESLARSLESEQAELEARLQRLV